MSEQIPFIGAPRNAGCRKTIEVVVSQLRRLGLRPKERLLDVGCGDGSFTIQLGNGFNEVFGIDVQETFLTRFCEAVEKDARFNVLNMSASAMSFKDAFFDVIVTVETLEHVADLSGTASEICRVLRPGGELFITVPNRWFPFENHGIRVGSWEKGGRIPLLTYCPWLHRRIAIARVFKVADLDRLFIKNGLRRADVSYLWPTFEHGGNRFQRFLKPLFGLMRKMEHSPLQMFGSSVVVKYVK